MPPKNKRVRYSNKNTKRKFENINNEYVFNDQTTQVCTHNWTKRSGSSSCEPGYFICLECNQIAWCFTDTLK